MFRISRSFALLLSAALIAGCGGDSPDGQATKQTPVKPSQAAPSSGGELRVGATDGGIGDATTGDSGGTHVLPSTKVPGESNTQQGVGAGASCDSTDLAPTGENLATVVASTLCLLNGERSDAGLGPLKQNPKLASAAVQHSQEMVAKQYFDHTGKDGTDPVDRIRNAGYIPSVGSWTVGENLAWGTGTLATPKEIVAAWMKSQGHRENILRPAFREIGFGVVIGNPRSNGGSGATYTTTFGGVSNASAAVKKAKKKTRKVRRTRKARASKNKAKTPRAKIARPSGSN